MKFRGLRRSLTTLMVAAPTFSRQLLGDLLMIAKMEFVARRTHCDSYRFLIGGFDQGRPTGVRLSVRIGSTTYPDLRRHWDL